MANEGKEPEMEDRMKKFYKKGIGVALAVTMASSSMVAYAAEATKDGSGAADVYKRQENSRILYRAILWSAGDDEKLNQWFSTNFNVEVHAYVKNGKYCVVNNTYEPQDTTVYRGDGSSFDLHMEANEIKWYEI